MTRVRAISIGVALLGLLSGIALLGAAVRYSESPWVQKILARAPVVRTLTQEKKAPVSPAPVSTMMQRAWDASYPEAK